MWRRVWRVVRALGLAVAWVVGLVFGVTWFLHGINGYPPCPGVGPGESCAFTSARGTIRVPYEDLGDPDPFSLVLGSVTLLVLAGWLWATRARARAWWKGGSEG